MGCEKGVRGRASSFNLYSIGRLEKDAILEKEVSFLKLAPRSSKMNSFSGGAKRKHGCNTLPESTLWNNLSEFRAGMKRCNYSLTTTSHYYKFTAPFRFDSSPEMKTVPFPQQQQEVSPFFIVRLILPSNPCECPKVPAHLIQDTPRITLPL